jgi:hypothetical protein
MFGLYPLHLYQQVTHEGKVMLKVSGRCSNGCGQQVELYIPFSEYQDYLSGTKIQYAMPSLIDSEREFLLTGICPHCWDTLMCEELPTDEPPIDSLEAAEMAYAEDMENNYDY